ncbi:uncharacterized protein L969DRAFT_88140 [Mixia osmundae IAM 14324]|uniref:uncharacterized protein n=1 Tax=Mixia osmundae (strain CBS 9802 / IAM 14324 / JCM 22182 / KY 12970) TaxID=764103 RepID=UPI0004A549BD|nr:uncharacterized protein L969DRAFT_88140 [Mixia osmundae IAM 14324]KEI38814.1 hypothetical protein L969DRAFT_88140 [Mixia osmundae IAM 14324]
MLYDTAATLISKITFACVMTPETQRIVLYGFGKGIKADFDSTVISADGKRYEQCFEISKAPMTANICFRIPNGSSIFKSWWLGTLYTGPNGPKFVTPALLVDGEPLWREANKFK